MDIRTKEKRQKNSTYEWMDYHSHLRKETFFCHLMNCEGKIEWEEDLHAQSTAKVYGPY